MAKEKRYAVYHKKANKLLSALYVDRRGKIRLSRWGDRVKEDNRLIFMVLCQYTIDRIMIRDDKLRHLKLGTYCVFPVKHSLIAENEVQRFIHEMGIR